MNTYLPATYERREERFLIVGWEYRRWTIRNDLKASMGYNIANWEMIRTREEFVEKLGLDGADDTHTLLNNMVDVRACYKPNGKVSSILRFYPSCCVCVMLMHAAHNWIQLVLNAIMYYAFV